MTFENPSLSDQLMEAKDLQKSLQELIQAQTETIKTQNQTIQNQNLQIQGMQQQLMTVIQMSQERPSPLSLEKANFEDSWEEPEQLEETSHLDPITFPEFLEGIAEEVTTDSTEQPAIIGEESGRDASQGY